MRKLLSVLVFLIGFAVVLDGALAFWHGDVAVTPPPPLTPLTPANTWNGTPGTGGAVPSVDTSIHGQLTICGTEGSTGGGTTGYVVIDLCGSNATVATGDQWTVGTQNGLLNSTCSGCSDVGGTVEANGTWLVINKTSNKVQLCGIVNKAGTDCTTGPSYTNAWTSGGTIGVPVQPTCAFDEVQGQLITADNVESVGVACAIVNRGWIDNVKCYFEGNNKTLTIDQQTVNPTVTTEGSPGTYATHGLIFAINTNTTTNQNGLAQLYCDATPTNGIVRRIGMRFWINAYASGGTSGGNGYVNRTTTVKYADASVVTPDASCATHTGAIGDPYSTLTWAIRCSTIGGQVFAKGVFAQATIAKPTACNTTATGTLCTGGKRIDVYPWPTFTYTIGQQFRNILYITSNDVVFHSPTVDMASISQIFGACPSNNCAPVDSFNTRPGSGTVFQGATFIDSNAVAPFAGATFGYINNVTYNAATFSQNTNQYYAITESSLSVGNFVNWTFQRNNIATNINDMGDIQLLKSAKFNVVETGNALVSAPFLGGGPGWEEGWGRATLLPENTPNTVVGSANNAALLPTITSTSFSGGSTQIQTSATTGNSSYSPPGYVEFLDGAHANQWVATTGWTTGGLVTVSGDYHTATGRIFVTFTNHADMFKFNYSSTNPQSPSNLDYNIYFQNVFSVGGGQSSFVQTGGWEKNSTIVSNNLSGCPGDLNTGTCVTISGADTINVNALPIVGNFVWIRGAGTNQFQARKITTVVDATHFTVDHAFFPDISAGVTWNIGQSVLNGACVACRFGGSSATYPAQKAQMQDPWSNFAYIQFSEVYGDFNLLPQGGSGHGAGGAGRGSENFAADYFAIYDSNMGHLANGIDQCAIANETNCVQHSYEEGLVFDTVNFTDSSTAYGTHYSNQLSTFDSSYKPNGTLTTVLRGTIGNAHLADGSPLYPWNPDGTIVSPGVVVGAIR